MASILGLSAFYHDSAAALVIDGEVSAAVQEERFSRKKYDAAFPARAIDFCLSQAGLRPHDLDYVVFYEKPLAKFERLIETYLAFAPAGYKSFAKSMPLWLKDKLYMRRTIRRSLPGCEAPLVFIDHHESHAAGAFFPSPFEEAAILTMDGVGEWSTTTYGAGRGNTIQLLGHLQFPHSLGLLYSAFTYYCGFKVNSGEYKLMGLAPYGEPSHVDSIYQHLIDLKPDGSFRLNMDYFNYCQGLTMTNERFHRLFGGAPRKEESNIEQRHMDLAASIQKVTEEIVLRIGRHVHRETKMKNLVMAGGVALNCVANGRLLREGPFESIWIQPGAGDAGSALGAALFVWHQLLDRPRQATGRDRQKGSFLGPAYSSAEVRQFLDQIGARYHAFRDEGELLEHVAQALATENIVGWFRGRAEFGPRALGARSILGDPRSAQMQAMLNLKIKFRESFRPFAPCVLQEHAHEWFRMRPGEESPYMLMVAPVLEEHRMALSAEDRDRMEHAPDLRARVQTVRSSVPAITHVDYSARVQTVDEERHGRYYRLMKRFYEKTGCPIIVNTSFNLSWEPIVLTPQEAYNTFMQSEMDLLVLEDCVLQKKQQPLGLALGDTNGHVDGATLRETGGRDAEPSLPEGPRAGSPWADPLTGEPLLPSPAALRNPITGTSYAVEEGIPRLFVLTDTRGNGAPDVTETVKQFYEKSPFPNYDDLDSQRALVEKARAGVFARLLNDQIPYDARVVEIGCGTGQLTNFLSIAHRSALGVDVCLNSLRLAQRFKEEQGLDRAAFAQMNLFRPALKDGFFDFVISNGVLHHTADPRGAFGRISRLLKPGGFLVVGLYSAYSRQLHYARRAVFRWTGLTSRWLDPHFARVSAVGKRAAWFQDQYCHPHESSHTIDEVLGWMDENGLDYVNSIPKPAPGPVLTSNERLFETRSAASSLSRVLSQFANMASGYREGGFFITIGRRRG